MTDWLPVSVGVFRTRDAWFVGVASVHTIYNYYKTFGHKTIVMVKQAPASVICSQCSKHDVSAYTIMLCTGRELPK